MLPFLISYYYKLYTEIRKKAQFVENGPICLLGKTEFLIKCFPNNIYTYIINWTFPPFLTHWIGI